MALRILLILAAILAPWNGGSALGLGELLASAKPALVKIVVEGKDPDNNTRVMPGTGFFVLSRTTENFSVIATAAHVLGRPEEWFRDPNDEPKRKIWIERLDDKGILSRLPNPATVLAEDYAHDAALLAIDGTGFATLPLGQPFEDLRTGEHGLLVGYAANESVATLREGTRDQNEIGKFGLALRLNLVAAPGQSGGPVFAPNGKVVGLASFNHPKDAPQYHIASLASWVRNLLDPIANSVGAADSGARESQSQPARQTLESWLKSPRDTTTPPAPSVAENCTAPRSLKEWLACAQ